MTMKRIIAAVLSVLTLAVLAVPAFAYSTPNADYVKESAFTAHTYISGKTAQFDKFGGVGTNAGTKTATFAAQNGAWHLTNTTTGNTAYATGAKGSANTSNAYSQFVSTSEGFTVDLYAKFNQLPILATNQQLTDFGVTSGNPNNLYFSGLVLNICSAEKYMADSSKSNNELQAVFAFYDNEELGTNAALILPYGNRNAFASANAITYFFDLPTDYARYTLKFDPKNNTTNFYINGEEQYFDGGDEATFNGIALCYRATATTNFVNINLNNGQAAVKDNGGTTDFYLDQLDLYPQALTPRADGTNFLFEEEKIEGVGNVAFTNAYNYYRDFAPMAEEYFDPTFWSAFEGFINKGLALIEAEDQEGLDAPANSGTNGDWFINRFMFQTTAGVNKTSGGSPVTVNGTGTIIPANTPVLIGYDKLTVSHIDTDGKDLPWTNSATIVTKAGLNVGTDLTSAGGALNTTSWRVYIFEPTAAEGYYKVISLGGNNSTTRPVIPEGGFALVLNTNGKTNANLNSGYEYNKYNSALFFARNIHAVYQAGISNGAYVYLEGIDLENATIDTEGTFLTYKQDGVAGNEDHVYREGYIALTQADAEGRTSTTRDKFVGFKSNAFIKAYGADNALTYSIVGEGTVTATVGGEAVTANPVVALPGAEITLTAEGEGFKYWVGGNNAVLSTDATLTLVGGKKMTVKAVFEEAADAELFTVYYKDSMTGRIWDVLQVPAGHVLDTNAVKAEMKGYNFVGWSVENGTVINATTEIYSIYERLAANINVTIVDGDYTATTTRTYASTLALNAKGENFSYWAINGEIVSRNDEFLFSTPSKDVTITAVYGETVTGEATVASLDIVLADPTATTPVPKTFYYLMSRSVIEGATIKETGVLMTRKGTAADLVLGTTNKSVTRGVSTAPDHHDVVGFVKDAAGKGGKWYVRGYLTYEFEGQTKTVYANVLDITISETKLVAVTHNVKNETTDFAEDAAMYVKMGADVVASQEVISYAGSNYKSSMEAQGYTVYMGELRGTASILDGNEYNPIAFKTSRYVQHNGGTFWLSDTPDTQSKVDGAKYYRICTWVVLKDRVTGEYIQVFNTHLISPVSDGLSDDALDQARFKQVKALLSKMDTITRNAPGGVNNIILLGDFNVNVKDHGVVDYVSGSAKYLGEYNEWDDRLRLNLAENLAEGTIGGSTFDTIFVSERGMKIESTYAGSESGGSDHYPVASTCIIK